MSEAATSTQGVLATAPSFSRLVVLAGKLLVRDWRSGELGLLVAALVVAVATVAAIGLFVDRLRGAMVSESSQILAADRVISGSEPMPRQWLELASISELKQSEVLAFTSMLFVGDNSQLVAVKAVDDRYPLRGVLRIADAPFTKGELKVGGPAAGEVWVDSRLVPALSISLGSTVGIGVAELKVTKVVIAEPDRGGSMFSLGPRVLMNLADVPATEVVQPGSRVTYRLLLAGDENALNAYYERISAEIEPRFRWTSVRESSPAVGSALDRAESFMLLGGLLGVILAGIAIALAAHRYAERHFNHVAVMKSLGLGPNDIMWLFGFVLCILGAFATLLGCFVGYGVHALILSAVRELMPVELPPPGFSPYLAASVTSLICLLAFASPPLLKLRAVSPMRVIRGDVSGEANTLRWAYLAGALGCITLLVWYSGNLRLTMMVLIGALVISSVLMLAAYGLLRGGRRLGMQAGSALRLGLASLQRRGWQNSFQALVFGVAIMMLLVLVLVRTSLLDEWRAQLPEGAPNHFVLNIMPEEVETLQALVQSETQESNPIFPMMRGRIVKVNNLAVSDWARQRGDSMAGADRPESERNLTWADTLPAGNTLTNGQWWAADTDERLASLDEDYARSAGISVGDVLRLSIVDREIEVRVANIRRVDWDSMRPNFYLVFSSAAIRDLPATYMTSFHLPFERKLFLNRLLSQYPTVSVIEVDGLIQQVRQIVDRVTLAVELVMALVLASGALVLLAAVLSSLDQRVREHALLRTLGGARRLIQGALAVEFVALGAIAGFLAAVGAEISVQLLNYQIFELPSVWHPEMMILGPLVGILIVGGLGLLATRAVVTTPPVVVLRRT